MLRRSLFSLSLVFFSAFFCDNAWSAVHSVGMQQWAMDAWRGMQMTPMELKASGLRPSKCGTWAQTIIREDWEELPAEFRQEFERRTALAKEAQVQAARTFVWDSRFTIHYQDSGPNAVPDLDTATLTTAGFVYGRDGVPDYVQWVAHAFSYSCHYITDTLHYVYPVTHVGIRMLDLSIYYGLTYSSDSIDLDNDLGWFNPWEVNIRERYDVTVAHEFFHMVQFTMLASQPSYMNFFSEPSATWMEDEVYPTVNDYLQYLTDSVGVTIMNTPGDPLDQVDPYQPANYDRVVWPMFLDQRYSDSVILFAWRNYQAGDTNTVSVFGSAISTCRPGTTFQSAFTEFGRWLYYTGGRSAYASTYTDAALWPEAASAQISQSAFDDETPFNLAPLSLNYRKIRGRDDHSNPGIGLTGPNPVGCLSWAADTASKNLVLDSFWMTTDRLSQFPFGPLASSGEALGLFNFNPYGVSGYYYSFDSVKTYLPGRLLSFDIGSGFGGYIRISDTIRCVRTDTLGPNEAGRRLDAALRGNGFRDTAALLMGPPPSWEIRQSRNWFSALVPGIIDSLMDSGRLFLDLSAADSSDYYIHYRVAACNPLTGAALALDRDSGGWRLGYGAVRTGLPRIRTGLDSASYRVFYWEIERSRANLKADVFPNPAYTDDPRLYLTCDSLAHKTAECRLYTLSGKLVRTLRSDRSADRVAVHNASGSIVFAWDFTNVSGGRVGPGIYLYQILRKEDARPIIGKAALLGKKRG